MSTFTTALGEVYTVERRLPRVAWRPRYRGADPAFGDFAGAVDDSILGVIGAVFFAITLVIIVIPFLLFVAELALVIAIVIPVVLFGLAVGAVRHTVVIKAGDAKGRCSRAVRLAAWWRRCGRRGRCVPRPMRAGCVRLRRLSAGCERLRPGGGPASSRARTSRLRSCAPASTAG